MSTSVTAPTAQDSTAPRGDVIVNVFGKTDVGRTREHNEDSFVVADLTTANATLQPEVRQHRSGERGTLFMVADGMGGAAAGEIASSMAVDIVLQQMNERWRGTTHPTPETFAAALKLSTEFANAQIHRYAGEHPEFRGMGTTATVAGLLNGYLYVVQVGDSRAYLVRDGKAIQITKDQSLMQRLIDAGEITAEEAEHSERRNIILQAIGPEAMIKPDVTRQLVRRGDTLVLCSDGLSGQVRPEEIATVVSEEKEPMDICRRLIDMANAAGGPDNITVVAARFEGEGLQQVGEGDEVGHQVFAVSGENTPTLPMEKWVRRSEPVTVPGGPGGPGGSTGSSGGGAEGGRSAPRDTVPMAEPRMGTSRALIAGIVIMLTIAITFFLMRSR